MENKIKVGDCFIRSVEASKNKYRGAIRCVKFIDSYTMLVLNYDEQNVEDTGVTITSKTVSVIDAIHEGYFIPIDNSEFEILYNKLNEKMIRLVKK